MSSVSQASLRASCASEAAVVDIQEPGPINRLPAEILGNIFSQIREDSKKEWRLVSRLFNAVAINNITGVAFNRTLPADGISRMFNSEAIVASVTHLDLSNRVFSQDELVQLQVKFPNVHSLKLSEYNLERGVLSVVSVFSHLKSLDLSRCFRLFDEDLASPQWKLGAGLESLTLSACPRIGNNAIAILKGFTSLKSLQISFCPQVTDEGLHHLRRLTNLTSLDLNSMDNMTDAGLEHLRGLRNLRSLNLSFCSQVTDAGLGCIGQLTSLENLDLTNTPVTDAGFEHLRGLRNLRSLNLSFCSQVTDAAIAQLCLELPSLNVRRE